MAVVKYWVIDSGALGDAETPGRCQGLGNLAHHLTVGDGVLRVRYDTVAHSAHIGSLGRVESVDADGGAAAIDWRTVDFHITPGPHGRRHWEQKAYFVLNGKRARFYELPDQFAAAFDDPDWLGYRIADSFQNRIDQSGRLPTLDVVEGFVYLMQWENEYKIGKAVDVERRHKRLSRELDRDITVLHRIFSDDYTRAESDMHRRFDAKRLHGEWFALDPDDVAWLLSIERL